MEKEDLQSIGVKGIPNSGLEFRQHGYRFYGHYANGGNNGIRVWTCERMFGVHTLAKAQPHSLQSTGGTSWEDFIKPQFADVARSPQHGR